MKPPQPATPACSQSIEDLDGFVSGELEPAYSSRIERHIAVCGACSRFVGDRLRIRAALQSAVSADPGPPVELLGLVRERLQKESTQTPRRSTWQPLAMAAGIVLAATGAVAVAWMASGSGPSSGATSVAALRLAADADHHGKCVEEMAGRVPPPSGNAGHRDEEVTRLEAIVREQAIGGMTIVDAHRCTDGQRRYVHIVIEREGALAGVLVSDAGDRQAGGADGLPGVATAKAASYTAGGKVVSVFSDSAEISASELANRLRPFIEEQSVAAVLVIRRLSLM